MKLLQVALIGLGSRGSFLLRDTLLNMDNIQIAAVCDVYTDRTKDAADTVEAAGFPRPMEILDYKSAVDPSKVDCVLVLTSWKSHIEIAKYAMAQGIPVGCEVGGALNLDDCLDLVETQERTGTPYMFMENCNYGRRELMVLNMAQHGVLGEIVHCSGCYGHDLREEIAKGKENRHYRLNEYLNRNCENYPSHELGPIMQVLDINRSNRLVSLSSFSSKTSGMKEYLAGSDTADPTLKEAAFSQGDIVTTILTCANGETITLSLDTTLPRYYSRGFTIRGTKGMYEEATDSVFLDNEDFRKAEFDWKSCWGNAAEYEEAYDHELWKGTDPSTLSSGHGGMDWLCYSDFFDHVRSGAPMPIDVYDAAVIMAITPLSEQSIRHGNISVPIPDFKHLEKHTHISQEN